MFLDNARSRNVFLDVARFHNVSAYRLTIWHLRLRSYVCEDDRNEHPNSTSNSRGADRQVRGKDESRQIT